MFVKQKNNIIAILFILFAVLFLMFWKVGGVIPAWDFLIARPTPSWVAQYPTPVLPLPVGAMPSTIISPTPPSEPVDARSWGERLNDTNLPNLGDIKVKTYTNTEYGFSLKYPEGWKIKEYDVQTSGGVAFEFLAPSPFHAGKYYGPLILNIYKGKLKDELIRAGYLTERIKTYGFIPDVKINNIDMYIENPEVSSSSGVPLFIFFEKNNFIFFVHEISGEVNPEDHKFTEYIIKTFRFLK